MRRALGPSHALAAACALGGPTVLAFFAGGYGAEPRLVAALVAWACVLALALAGPPPLPRSRSGCAVVAGLAGLAAWSAVSLTWAPLRGPAVEAVQRLVLYLGALGLAIGVFRAPRVLRAAEPALAGGIAVVIGYGLAGRLLPSVLHLARSRSAGGRLEQPITYWNGVGALAAVGLVLCARIAGDATRPPAMRALAAAAVAPLGAGVYLSFSRGAVAVAVLGLIVLVAAAPARGQARAAGIALLTAAAAAVLAGSFAGVASLEGSLSARTREGTIVLVGLALLMGAAAVATRALRPDPRPLGRRLGRLAAGAVTAVAIALVAGGLSERASDAELSRGATPQRLATVSSNRYEYWRVGLDAFAREPLTGIGAAGFRVEWLRERRIREAVRDAHSLEVEMAAELGVVGLLAFGLMVGGAIAAGRRALRASPGLAAGAAAATLAWFVHASIDWDWQLPAVSLPAILLTGALIAIAESADAR